jgi:hypothetical protein
MKKLPLGGMALFAMLAVSLSVYAHGVQKIVTFDAPGSVGFTIGSAINVRGEIVGYFFDANGIGHSYLRSADGKEFTIFDVPNDVNGTYAYNLNDEGAVTGQYCDATVCHGFLRNPQGDVISFDASPDALNFGGTYGVTINISGLIAGFYTGMNGVNHGFVRTPDGKITTFDAPDAGTQPGQGTGVDYPGGLNDWGACTGGYGDENGNGYSFVRAPDGTLTEFNPPGGSQSAGQGINLFGVVTGNYTDDATGLGYVYVRSPDGKRFTSFAYPNAFFTYPNDINAFGVITGFYNLTFVNHGFVHYPDGTLTSFDAPGAGTTQHMGQGTFGFGINLWGAITGYVKDSNNASHGFVRLPPSP